MRSSIISQIVNCISGIARLGNIGRCELADHSPTSSYLRYRQPLPGMRTDERQSMFGFTRLFGTWRSLKPVPVVTSRPITGRPRRTGRRS